MKERNILDKNAIFKGGKSYLNDYYVDSFSEECFDLFYIAKK